MQLLILYATYSSGTDLATDVLKEELEDIGVKVTKKKIKDFNEIDLNNFSNILFATPSWRTRKGDGQPHEFFLDYMDTVGEMAYRDKKFAIMGLGDTAYTHFCGAVDQLEAFIQKNGGIIFHPSLKIDGFYFAQEENEQKIRDWAKQVSLHLH